MIGGRLLKGYLLISVLSFDWISAQHRNYCTAVDGKQIHQCAREFFNRPYDLSDQDKLLTKLAAAIQNFNGTTHECTLFWAFAACARSVSACFGVPKDDGGVSVGSKIYWQRAWTLCSQYDDSFGYKIDINKSMECSRKIEEKCDQPVPDFNNCQETYYSCHRQELYECQGLNVAERVLICDVHSFFLFVECAEPVRCALMGSSSHEINSSISVLLVAVWLLWMLDWN
ncbi:hypothetical protein M3Y98_01045100 [Aphelenchoides besseyi]|nr:hypothetical protein M3Y98_01045100 [Aphelenchoides besseyi]KAI6209840.1 hypothetical protein M3Y96_00263800 [Aphelenchoides besseyi]